jgi:hypothetical protein
MAITRKPKASSAAAPAAVDIDALINKGGSVSGQPAITPTEDSAAKPVPVVLRVPGDVLVKVDQALKTRRVRIPRHTWLLEAVVEKLEREGEASS